jgi:hypothetical protein
MRSSWRLVFLSAVIAVGVFASACDTQTGGAVTSGSTPRQTPGAPTVIPFPGISLKTPILGGSWKAFDTLFGHSNCCLENGWEYTGKFGVTFTGVIEADVNYNNQPNDPNDRVTGIEVAPTTGNWTRSQEETMVGQFLPPDAKLVQTKTVYDPNHAAIGIEKTYSSVLLAHTLPASDFKNANGKQAQAGTFYVYLDDGFLAVNASMLGTDESYVLMYGST